jgi:hypothetical protein
MRVICTLTIVAFALLPLLAQRPVPGHPPTNPRYGYNDTAYHQRYDDGYDKGRAAERDNARYDPTREASYRTADHGYTSRYGTKDDYRGVYREGFRAGYDDGYRGLERYARNRRLNNGRFP